MKTLLTVIGARPQWIKASAMSRVLQRAEHGMQEHVVHTGQHVSQEMSGIFFEELGMKAPDTQLEVEFDPARRMGQMMQGIAASISQVKPDAVLVYGDTDSTLAGAWAASRAGVPLIHMEAGLRSFDRAMPEEINRILTDQLSAVLLCPSEAAVSQLRKEGIFTNCRPGVLVQAAGDLMLDTACWIGGEPVSRVSNGNKVLLTLHRPSNVDDMDRLRLWMEAIRDTICQQGLVVIFPVHPRTAVALQKAYGFEWDLILKDWGIHVQRPAGYVQMMEWLNEVNAVWTDSGGVQKEAFFRHRPALVLRDTTEWTELLDVGAAVLSPEPNGLMRRNADLMARDFSQVFETNLFGDGHAAEHIAAALQAWFQK
jgi:UDP-GlcNAc3NAcA epimerase